MAIQIVRTPKTHPLNTVLLSNDKIYSFLIDTEEGIENIFAPLYDVGVIPLEFNGAVQWKSYLSPVKDQGSCGGCYAYAATSCLADRYNLYSGGKVHLDLSPSKIILCDLVGGSFENISSPIDQINVNIDVISKLGCHGNSLFEAWRYLYNIGTVTSKCFPTDLNEPCEKIMGEFYDSCYHSDAPAVFYRCNSVYLIRGTASTEGSEYYIRNNIYSHGPITTTIDIYENFYTFDPVRDIYHPQGEYTGGHAIIIDGWGSTKEGVDFWWVRNSWGANWGVNGYFRIERGVNSCKCEGSFIAGMPIYLGKSLFESVDKVSEISDIIRSSYTPFGGIDLDTGVSRRNLSYTRKTKRPSITLRQNNGFVAGRIGAKVKMIQVNNFPKENSVFPIVFTSLILLCAICLGK